MIIVDAHQDLAWNILTFQRDYSLAADEIRTREHRTEIPAKNGDTLLGWPNYQAGQVALIFSTLFAAPAHARLGDWDGQSYRDVAEAHRLYSAQLDAYYRLVDAHPDKFQLVRSRAELNAILKNWDTTAEVVAARPVGLVPLMEGAEAVNDPYEVENWWARGVRIIGPAWTGTRFCGGTRQPGPLTPAGFALLEAMATFGFSLDLSHMDEKAVLQALDTYPGPIMASHANAKSLLKGTESNRHLSDRVIGGIIERGGVIGIVPFNRFLVEGWLPSHGRAAVSLQHVVAQIDHICQLAGNVQHVGIGSDFDGGFGLQMTPAEIDTIADLQKLSPLLAEKGYTQDQIAAVLGQNWIRFLQESLPKG